MNKINSAIFLKCGLICFAILFFLPFLNISYIYAGNEDIGISSEAEQYRINGYNAQQRGDIDTAIEWYQKAVGIKPEYASPHNDLGILFETKGWLDRAEAEYEKALSIDLNYKEVHTNLALLYERKGELEKAAFHWMRRYKLGNPNDQWAQEAKARLEKLGLLNKPEKIDSPKIEQQAPVVKESQKKEKPKHEAAPKVKKYPNWRKAARPKKNKEPIKDSESKKVIEKELQIRKTAPLNRPVEKKQKPEPKPRVKKVAPVKKVVEKKQKPEPAPRVKKDSDWTKIAPEKNEEPVNISGSDKNLDKEIQESLKLAEERMRREKEGKKNSKEEIDTAVNSEANAAYGKAKDYYNKGEYTKALDMIRLAKQDSGQSSSKHLSELEDEIKFRMKEARIEDYYKEGAIRYRQKDFTGARKEFEAMLNILPE